MLYEKAGCPFRSAYQVLCDLPDSQCKVLFQEGFDDGCQLGNYKEMKCLLNPSTRRVLILSLPLMIERLESRTEWKPTSFFLDATYKICKEGLHLYGLLVDVNLSGYPVGYMFIGGAGDAGDTKRLGFKFLTLMKQAYPDLASIKTAHVDKDMSEIANIKSVFPHTDVKLCWWHVNKAVRLALATRGDSKSLDIREDLGPEANEIVLEWNKLDQVDENPLSERDRKLVRSEMDAHMMRHPYFESMTAENIRRDCVTHMLKFVYSRFPQKRWIFGYLYRNWYTLRFWTLWAHSAYEAVPIHRTTMIIESHWKWLKYYALAKKKPRLDALFYIIIPQVYNSILPRMSAYVSKTHKTLEGERKKLAIKRLAGHQANVDIKNWICPCRYYTYHRHMMCAHLVQKFLNDVC